MFAARDEARRAIRGLGLAEIARDHPECLASEAFDRADALLTRGGPDSLTPAQRGLTAVWWFDAEVNNGGLHQYFLNSAGDEAGIAREWLRRFGATAAADLLDRAVARMPGGRSSPDREERPAAMDGLPLDRFDDLDDAFHRLSASPSESLERWIRENPDELALPPDPLPDWTA